MRASPAAAVVVLTFLMVLGAGTPGRTQEPQPELAMMPADTLVLAAAGTVTGLAWMGPDSLALLTIVPDSRADSSGRGVRLVVQDRAGRILRQGDFAGILARGLAFDGRYLWACGDVDDGSSLLYRLSPDVLQVEAVFDLPGHRPSGVCFDGEFLWVADRDAGRLDRCDPGTGALTRTVVAPAFSPCGVAWDGRAVWLTDSGTGRLYRLAGPRLTLTGTVRAQDHWQRGADIPLAHDGVSLWYVPADGQFAVRAVFP